MIKFLCAKLSSGRSQENYAKELRSKIRSLELSHRLQQDRIADLESALYPFCELANTMCGCAACRKFSLEVRSHKRRAIITYADLKVAATECGGKRETSS